jgi:flagellar protein FlaJ
MSLDTADSDQGLEAIGDGVADLFYPLYRRIFNEDQDFVETLELKLKQARITDTVEVYLSRSLGVGVLVALLFGLIGGVVGYLAFYFFDLLSIIQSQVSLQVGLRSMPAWTDVLLTVLSAFVFGFFGFLIGFGALISVPYFRASGRKREINMLLPDAVSFMYALSEGGLNQLEVIEAVADAEDTYGEVALEFQSIINESEYFDTDYRSAISTQARESPSRELRQFLTDMLSIMDSGGDMTRFFQDKKNKHMRTAKKQREMTLDTLELFGEMYMTLAMFPLLLIIIFVIMGMLGNSTTMLIFFAVYGLIPMIGMAFIVLVATVKIDDPGDGYLSYHADETDEARMSQGVLNTALANRFAGTYEVFDRIKSREVLHETAQHLKHPHIFFKENPLYVLAVTVPASLVAVAAIVVSGAVPTTWGRIIEEPVWSTFTYLYLPIYINFLPLGFFYEWNVYSRKGITNTLSDDLRQLASANNTGMTLLQSLRTVSQTSSGKLADEFEVIAKKVDYGMSLHEALIEFNNKYHIPRLARTIKLITEAERASNHITDVLSTAAQASENNDDIERERKSRTRMQVAIIIMTFLSLLGVMAILQVQFIGTLADVTQEASQATEGGGAGGAGAGFGGQVNADQLSLLFFHAVTFQAITSGLIAGYIRDAKILSGVKYIVILQSIALAVWIGVGLLSGGGGGEEAAAETAASTAALLPLVTGYYDT